MSWLRWPGIFASNHDRAITLNSSDRRTRDTFPSAPGAKTGKSAADDRLQRSLRRKSELLSGMLPASPSDDVLVKILHGIEARRNKKKKAALTAAGSFAVALVIVGVAATSSGLFGVSSHSSHAQVAGVAAPVHAAATNSARAGAVTGRLMLMSRPSCAAGALGGQLLAGCTGTIITHPSTFGAVASSASNSSSGAGHADIFSAPSPALLRASTCPSSFVRMLYGHGLGKSITSHEASQTAITLIPGEYLEIGLVPLTRSSKWILKSSPPIPTSTSNASASSIPSHGYTPILSLCTVRSPVAGGMVIVARAMSAGTQMITASELSVANTCSTAGSRNAQSHGVGSSGAASLSNTPKSTASGNTATGATGRKCTAGKDSTTAYQSATYSLKVVVRDPAQAGNGFRLKTNSR